MSDDSNLSRLNATPKEHTERWNPRRLLMVGFVPPARIAGRVLIAQVAGRLVLCSLWTTSGQAAIFGEICVW